MAVEHLFRFVAPPGIRGYVSPTWGTVRRDQLTPAQALDLWQRGCPYLELLPTGAAELFGSASVQELRALAHQCRTLSELEAIAALKPESITLQRAADIRRATLTASA